MVERLYRDRATVAEYEWFVSLPFTVVLTLAVLAVSMGGIFTLVDFVFGQGLHEIA